MFESSQMGERSTVVVVPSNIHRVLTRNKLKFPQYLDFEKIRAVISSEDYRFWLGVVDALNIGGVNLSNNLMGSIWDKGRIPDIGSDADKHIDPIMMASQLDKEEALSYLNQSNAMTENFYSLHREGSTVFVVVEEGFMLKLEDSNFKLEFLKSYLKKLSEILPVHKLANDPLHIQYVSLVTSL